MNNMVKSDNVLLYEEYRDKYKDNPLFDKVVDLIDRIGDKKLLLITTSNRWEGDDELPKSSLIAYYIASKVKNNIIIDIPKLIIHPCEGNVSKSTGNNCGVKESLIKDKSRNKSGELRCWASFNHKDDELYKVSDAILESDIVIFTGSVRWGAANIYFQKLIERLTWIENRHTSLGEENIVKDIETGCIFLGHNYNVDAVIDNALNTFKFFGFKTDKKNFISNQYTKDSTEESIDSYNKENKMIRDSFPL